MFVLISDVYKAVHGDYVYKFNKFNDKWIVTKDIPTVPHDSNLPNMKRLTIKGWGKNGGSCAIHRFDTITDAVDFVVQLDNISQPVTFN